jgi:hypothetical protein
MTETRHRHGARLKPPARAVGGDVSREGPAVNRKPSPKIPGFRTATAAARPPPRVHNHHEM